MELGLSKPIDHNLLKKTCVNVYLSPHLSLVYQHILWKSVFISLKITHLLLEIQ